MGVCSCGMHDYLEAGCVEDEIERFLNCQAKAGVTSECSGR